MKFIKSQKLLFFFVVCIYFTLSCAKEYRPQNNPLDRDTSKSKNYPRPEELFHKKRLVSIVVGYHDRRIADSEVRNIIRKISVTFRKSANIYSQKKLLQRNILRGKDISSLSSKELYKLGAALEVDFFMRLEIRKEKLIEDEEETFTFVEIFAPARQQLVIKKQIPFRSAEEFDIIIKAFVQTYFPLQGYVLETKNSRQFIKVNVGSRLGIKNGRNVSFYKRKIETTVTPTATGNITTKKISIIPQVIAQGKVISVEEEVSWILVEENQSGILLGLVAIFNPE